MPYHHHCFRYIPAPTIAFSLKFSITFPITFVYVSVHFLLTFHSDSCCFHFYPTPTCLKLKVFVVIVGIVEIFCNILYHPKNVHKHAWLSFPGRDVAKFDPKFCSCLCLLTSLVYLFFWPCHVNVLLNSARLSYFSRTLPYHKIL